MSWYHRNKPYDRLEQSIKKMSVVRTRMLFEEYIIFWMSLISETLIIPRTAFNKHNKWMNTAKKNNLKIRTIDTQAAKSIKSASDIWIWPINKKIKTMCSNGDVGDERLPIQCDNLTMNNFTYIIKLNEKKIHQNTWIYCQQFAWNGRKWWPQNDFICFSTIQFL